MKPIDWSLLPIGESSKLRRWLEEKADAKYDEWKLLHAELGNPYRPRRERSFLGVYLEEVNE